MSLSELLKDLQVTVQTAILLEGKLKDEKLIDDLKTVVKTAKRGFTAATGGALHRLHNTKPSIDAVKKLVQGIPNALSFKNECDQLPVQSAVWNIDSLKYLPILAKEGKHHEVGGRGMRGGLLVADPLGVQWNSLQLLAHLFVNAVNPSDSSSLDTACLNALKELRVANLFLKEDVKKYSLLYHSCNPIAKMRFEYLAEWYPDCLMTDTFKDLPLSHAFIKHFANITCFTMYFQTALKHHPRHLGMLFQRDGDGQAAYERAIEKHGNDKKDKAFNVIKQCIPTDTFLPILHHVIKEAPKYMNDFTSRYPSALYHRDEDGRTLTQAAIASGAKTFQNDSMFIGKMTDDEIAELDPVTKQYPFLTCAACDSCDLSTIYVLLSRNPSLLEKYTEQTTDDFAEEVRRRKRKRDTGLCEAVVNEA